MKSEILFLSYIAAMACLSNDNKNALNRDYQLVYILL